MVLEDFINQILIEKGYTAKVTDKAIYDQLIKDGVEKLEDKLKYCMFEAIPEKDMPEFDRLMDLDDADKLQSFISRVIPNLAELQSQALIDFKNNYF